MCRQSGCKEDKGSPRQGEQEYFEKNQSKIQIKKEPQNNSQHQNQYASHDNLNKKQQDNIQSDGRNNFQLQNFNQIQSHNTKLSYEKLEKTNNQANISQQRQPDDQCQIKNLDHTLNQQNSQKNQQQFNINKDPQNCLSSQKSNKHNFNQNQISSQCQEQISIQIQPDQQNLIARNVNSYQQQQENQYEKQYSEAFINQSAPIQEQKQIRNNSNKIKITGQFEKSSQDVYVNSNNNKQINLQSLQQINEGNNYQNPNYNNLFTNNSENIQSNHNLIQINNYQENTFYNPQKDDQQINQLNNNYSFKQEDDSQNREFSQMEQKFSSITKYPENWQSNQSQINNDDKMKSNSIQESRITIQSNDDYKTKLKTTQVRCQYCQNEVQQKYFSLQCQHFYCQDCLIELVKNQVQQRNCYQFKCSCSKPIKLQLFFQQKDKTVDILKGRLIINQINALKQNIMNDKQLRNCKNKHCQFFVIMQDQLDQHIFYCPSCLQKQQDNQ